jgi:serine/threonine protein kinase
MTSTSESYSTRTNRPKLVPGTELQNRYRVVRQLGKGGMGAVYEAIDLRLDATVAIKEAFSRDARLRKQFEHEARLLAQLNHAALPRVMDYFSEDERVFLVMQFIAGDDLAEIISTQPGPLPRNTVIAWADQLLDALIYLHTRERQIIHRDIKPHNLKLTADGKIALLDFGLAKTDSGTLTGNSSASIFGFTRRYSPPEQMKDEGTSPQSDIYALGATLYHLLTGVKPPDAMVRTAAIAKSEADPLRPANELHAAVGPEISAILLKAMELNPARRFTDANEFREALKRLGRENMRALQNWSEQGASDCAGRPNINVTVVRQQAVDPFDSYSILKPAEVDWFIPKPSRRPFVVIALIGLLLVGGVFAFSDASGWPDVSKATADYVRAKREGVGVVTSDEKKGTEKSRVNYQENLRRSEGVSKNSQSEPQNRKQNGKATTKRIASARPRPMRPPPPAVPRLRESGWLRP